MICIIAANYADAKRFAFGQEWEDSEWFFAADEVDLLRRNNFHVLVIASSANHIPESYFNKMFTLAKKRGRIGRV